MLKSEKFVEGLCRLRVEIVENPLELSRFMQTHGRVGAGKVIDEGMKVRALDEFSIEDYVGTLPLTYTEKARLVLLDVLELMGVKRFRYATNEIYSQPPLFARTGVHEGEWAYVDIRSAYPTIYKHFLTVKYRRGRYMSDAIITPFVEILSSLSKRVRNSIFGIMRVNKVRRYWKEGNKIVFKMLNAPHNLLNPDLINLTYDTLQSIAVRAVRDFNAVYVNTDGAIVPLGKASAYMRFLSELGFESKIRLVGETAVIKACNAYKVGSYESLSFKYVRHERDFSNLISEEDAQWVLRMYGRKIQRVL